MALDDREPEENESNSCDEALLSALEALRSLTQTDVAAEIGISERRLRDIEQRRSTPRRKTRDAIIRLAEKFREGRTTGEPVADSESEGAIGGLIFGGLLFVGMIVILILLGRPSEA